MTMIARHALKRCVRRRAVAPEMLEQGLISNITLGRIEPLPECQSEQRLAFWGGERVILGCSSGQFGNLALLANCQTS